MWRSGCLVGDNLDTLNVARRLENLAQHVLGDARVQSTDIEGPFVRLGSGAARSIARPATGGGHGVARHGRADGSWDWIVVLRNNYRSKLRGRHVLLVPAVVAGSGCRRRRGRQRSRGGIGHGCAREGESRERGGGYLVDVSTNQTRGQPELAMEKRRR